MVNFTKVPAEHIWSNGYLEKKIFLYDLTDGLFSANLLTMNKLNKHIWKYSFLIQRNDGEMDRFAVLTDTGKNKALRQLEIHMGWLVDNCPAYMHPTGFFIYEGKKLEQRRHWK